MAVTDKNKSTVERLKDLKSLYESGILTKEEMEAEKAEILGNLEFSPSKQPVSRDKAEPQKEDKGNIKKKRVIQIVNEPPKKRFWESPKVISVAVISVIAIIVIAVLCVNQCQNRVVPLSIAIDSLAVDTTTVDSVIDEETPTTFDNHTEIRNIKEKRGNFEVDIDRPVSMAGIDDISKLQRCIVEKSFDAESNDIDACVESYFEEREQWAANEGGADATGHVSVKFRHRYGDFFVFDISRYVADSKFMNEGIGGPHGSDSSINFNNKLGRELKLGDLTDNEEKFVEVIKAKSGNETAHAESFAVLPIGVVCSWAFRPPWYECVLLDYGELGNALSGKFKKLINNDVWTPCVLSGQQGNKNIRLEFERKGDQLRNCTFIDINLNEKTSMDGKITNTEIIFTSKNLRITISKHNLETVVVDGSKNESVYWGYGS